MSDMWVAGCCGFKREGYESENVRTGVWFVKDKSKLSEGTPYAELNGYYIVPDIVSDAEISRSLLYKELMYV